MRTSKVMQSYRLDQLTVSSIDALAERHGASKAGIVAAAVELLMRWDESDPIGYIEHQRDNGPTYEPITERERGAEQGSWAAYSDALSRLQHLAPRL